MKQDLNGHNFRPKGAVAFFIALIAVFGASWLGFYAILLMRQHG